MAAPDAIRRLVEQFDEHREVYHSPGYNETQVRRDFIDPFFAALGWDVDNRKGYSEAYREVIHEDAIKIGGSTKAPDYCFRVGAGVRTFFVEAKKPSVDLRADAAPAFQLRRYAWSAKLPISILTDFEEFALYDCRIRPAKTDKASTGRVMYIRYTDYLDKWDELAGLLSPEAIRRGAIDKFLGTKKLARGTAEVDREFLAEIESWRDVLARNIAMRNQDISQRDLNFAVQRTIDRIVFLRICEDRGIEPYGTLRALENGPTVYPRLGELFHRADERYNSGLFHFTREKDRREPPDEMTLGLTIDDKVLKDLLHNLYYPESPYEFSVLPAEILGQVYEQFLGKVIRLTKGHQAKVEEKPEVKKAGGVYYTPAYIVEYIVRHTIGKLIEGKTPQEIGGLTKAWKPAKSARPLAVVDPACGSGSFLLGAYQFLLDWHRDWYETDGPEKHAAGSSPRLYRAPAGEWRLTTAERKRILLAHIHGVDIDSQAVEVTKLSLLLKVLEGESGETIELQRRLFHERALPDLSRNIKCGNSLIAPDFYDNRQQDLFDEEEALRINAFDWKTEFPEMFQGPNPGFDAVIGNPPYGASATEDQLAYYRQHFLAASGSADSYGLFIEQASRLLAASGLFGMIVQSACVAAPSMSSLRDVFVKTFRPIAFATMPYDVFAAYVDTVIIVAERLQRDATLLDLKKAMVDLVAFPPRFKVASVSDFDDFAKTADARKWLRGGKNEFLVTLSDAEQAIVAKVLGIGAKFSDVADIQRGVTPFETFDKPVGTASARAFKGTVRRYKCEPGPRQYIRYDETLAEYKPHRYFQGPRLLLRELISRQFQLQAVLVEESFVTNKSMQSLLLADPQYDIRYLLALLNSRLMSWLFLAVHSVGRRDDFPKIVLKQTRELPFRAIDFKSKPDRARHDRMVSLVEAMLKLHEEFAKAKEPHRRTVLERRIAATDRRIDQLVCELYALSDEEIAIVEQATETNR